MSEKGLRMPLLSRPTMPGAVAPGAVGAVAHPEALEQLADAGVDRRPAVAADHRRVVEVLACGEPVVEAGVLGEHAGAAPQLVAVGRRVEAEHAGRAPVRVQHAVQQPERHPDDRHTKIRRG